MSLRITNRGTNSSLFTLAPVCFTKANSEEVAGVKAPYGVLAGTVAAIGGSDAEGNAYGDYVVCPANGTLKAVGLFLNNAEGAPFENSPAVASGKIAIFQKMGSGETDIYANVTFKLGDYLYSDANGYLTNVESANKQILGTVTKVPSAADPFLGFDLAI